MIKLVFLLLLPAVIITLFFLRVRLYFSIKLPSLKDKKQGMACAYIAIGKIRLIEIPIGKEKKNKEKERAGGSELFIGVIKKIKRIILFKVSLSVSTGDAAASAITASGIGVMLNAIVLAVAPSTQKESVKINVVPIFSDNIEIKGEAYICISFSLRDLVREYIRATIRKKRKSKENKKYE